MQAALVGNNEFVLRLANSTYGQNQLYRALCGFKLYTYGVELGTQILLNEESAWNGGCRESIMGISASTTDYYGLKSLFKRKATEAHKKLIYNINSANSNIHFGCDFVFQNKQPAFGRVIMLIVRLFTEEFDPFDFEHDDLRI